MNQNQVQYTCTFYGHENEPIVSFCINLQCTEKPQCCVNCLLNKHLHHKEDCKTIKKMKEIFKSEIIFINEWCNKAEQNHQNVLKVHIDVIKLLDSEKKKLIEFDKKLEQPNCYLYNKDFYCLKELAAMLLRLPNDPEKFFLSALEEVFTFEDAILSFENIQKQKKKKKMTNVEEDKDDKALLEFYDFISTKLFFVSCEKEQCYSNIQCCNSCVITNLNQVQVFPYIASILKQEIKKINIWVSAEEKMFEQWQTLYLFIKEFFQKKLLDITDKDFRLNDSEFNFFIQNFENIKQWFTIKQALFQINNDGIFSCTFIIILADFLEKLIALQETLTQSSQIQNESTILCKQILNIKLKNVSKIKKEKQQQQPLEILDHLCQQGKVCLLFLGLDLFQQNDYEKAIQCFEQAIQINLNDSNALKNKDNFSFCIKILGRSLNELKRFEDAIVCFDQAIKIDPINFSGFYNKGCSLNELKRFVEAIQSFDQAIQIDPNSSCAFYDKSYSLKELKRFEDAIQCLDQAIQIDPKNFCAYYNKGYSLNELKRFEEAIKSFDKAIQLDPNISWVFFNKGYSLNQLYCFEDAIKCFDQAIKIDPNYCQALINKVRLCLINQLKNNIQGFSLNEFKFFDNAIECFDLSAKLNLNYYVAQENQTIDDSEIFGKNFSH